MLSVISSRPDELEPVFQAMLENAARICDAKFGTLFRFDEPCVSDLAAQFWYAIRASRIPSGSADHFDAVRAASWIGYANKTISDTLPMKRAEPRSSATSGNARRRAIRLVYVPMLKDDRADRRYRHLPSGGSSVHRQADRTGAELRRPGRHRHREHAAAQRTAAAHDDLTESLEQQTATSEVLKRHLKLAGRA